MATHSSILTWRLSWTEEPGWATVHGVTKSQTQLSDFHFLTHIHLDSRSAHPPNSGPAPVRSQISWPVPSKQGLLVANL